MTRESKQENSKESRSADDPAAGLSTKRELTDQPLPRTSSQRVLIPPIRSLTTRDPLHYTSNATLRAETDGQGRNESPQTLKADPASTIAQAIAQLENILEEACRLAQSVSEVEHQTATAPREPEPPRRRPSDSITYKGLRYLDEANKQESSTWRPVDVARMPTKSGRAAPQTTHPSNATDNDDIHNLQEPTQRTKSGLKILPPRPVEDPTCRRAQSRVRMTETNAGPSIADIKAYIRGHDQSPVTHRTSSRPEGPQAERPTSLLVPPILMLNGEDLPKDEDKEYDDNAYRRSFSHMFGMRSRHTSVDLPRSPPSRTHTINLKRVSHVDVLNKTSDFDVFDTCTHAPVARDWPTTRKRFTAATVCLNTICLGTLIGIYAGEVPAIQYRIADFHHYTILGNVVLYCGIAISTFALWPLPLLHGRKPYTVMGFALAFGLQIPQGISVATFRMPGNLEWRVLLLLSRALSGCALGLVNINLQATLLDLFGSSLQSQHPHGESPDPYDVRRHGGGMGLWLAAWSWCSIGSISFGFMIGAFIIENATVDWGFWTSLLVLMFIIALNVITPETRRSAYRRTVAEFAGQEGAFSRVARGEIKMHLKGSGPYWWGEEVQAGLEMSWLMLKQPGFLVLALYAAWAYAQFTLIMMVSPAMIAESQS